MNRLFKIQQRLTVAKSERGSGYVYRTLPKTLQALLPELGQEGLVMTLPCVCEQRTNGTYIVASCQLWDAESGDMVASATYATLDQNAMIKGGQGTGAAATYAKKGAIDSLFLLDANNPDMLDLDDIEGLQRAAEREEDRTARAYEKRVKACTDAIAACVTMADLRRVSELYDDVRKDERVERAGRYRQERIGGKGDE